MTPDLHSVTDEEWAAMSWLDRANVMTTTAEKARHMGLTESSLAFASQAAQFIQLHKAFAPMDDLCSDCPPEGYPTDETRCSECPRRKKEQS